MVPYPTPIVAEKDSVIFVTKKVTVATGKPCKNPYILALQYANMRMVICTYALARILVNVFLSGTVAADISKTNSVTPIFYF